MVLSLGIILLFLMFWIKHRNDHKEVFDKLPQKENELKVLYPLAYVILQLLVQRKINIFNKRTKHYIDSLNVVAESKENEVIYAVKKISLALVIILVAAIFSVLYEISQSDSDVLSDNALLRPDYWQQAQTHEFTANDKALQIEVKPREYTFSQVQENFQMAYEDVLTMIKGENLSLEQVSSDLNLITYLEKYAINISWMSSDTETVDLYGVVNNYNFAVGETREVELTATFTYQEYQCQYEINIMVIQPVLTEEEEFIRQIQLIIRENEQGSRQNETVALPENVNGTPIKYEEIKENYSVLLLILGIVTAVAIFPGMDKDLAQKVEARNKEMILDYSEIVSKLNILSGAGMSILHAWEKIVKDYEKKIDEEGKSKRFAYEEMRITYYEIQSGKSESNAYSDFGKRCNIHEYLKLGALLEQNVRKGAKGLAKMLEDESVQAFEQRKNLAKKLGEEAGTKMLIPMIIMLAIVMVIVMIPAFTSFGV